MKHWPLLLVACLLLAGLANASQVTHISASKVRSSDFSSDGNVTFNSTSPTGMTVNNSGYCLGHWASSLRGCVVNTTLTAWRNWTLPDADGTFLLGPAPIFTDYTNANHDHLDADDGGTLSASAIASGTMARARLPSQIAYEDEANVYSLVQTFSDGISVSVGECIAYNADSFLCRNGANSLNTTGAFTAETLWSNGAFRANSTVIFDDFSATRIPFFGTGGLLQDDSGFFYDASTDTLNDISSGSGSATLRIGTGSTTTTQNAPVATLSARNGANTIVNLVALNRDSGTAISGLLSFQIANSGGGLNEVFRLTPSTFEPSTDDFVDIGTAVARYQDAFFSGKLLLGGEAEIDGALNHDGATAGFFGVAPVAQVACVAAAAGGAVIDSQARAAANGALAALKSLGLMASGC